MLYALPVTVRMLILSSATPSAAQLHLAHLDPPPVAAPFHHHLKYLQADVRHVTQVTYRAYMDSCMGHDEFVPTTNECEHWFNVGLTVLDSLDTLLLMRLKSEYDASRAWAASSLSFHRKRSLVSLFEIVIRALGGMNSAYQLTNDSLWLNKSIELGDMLLYAFNGTRSKCPSAEAYLGSHIALKMHNRPPPSSTTAADVGTLQLEMRTLSHFANDSKYKHAVDQCMDVLMSAYPKDSMVTPIFDVNDGKFRGSRWTIGGTVDSMYEMMLKNWVMWGKNDTTLRTRFEQSVSAIMRFLSKDNGRNLYIGEMIRNRPATFKPHMDHLVCFFPATLAYAALHGLGGGVNGTRSDDYLPIARRLTKSCFDMTTGVASGLAGEVTSFEGKPVPKQGQDTNYLRPEIVEALYYMDKIDPAGGDTYKLMGREMWNKIRTFAQVEGREDGLISTTTNLLGRHGRPSHSGKLHSFVLAETLKYFYLLFDVRKASDADISLREWVFNTEAHPVRIVRHY